MYIYALSLNSPACVARLSFSLEQANCSGLGSGICRDSNELRVFVRMPAKQNKSLSTHLFLVNVAVGVLVL